MLSTHVAPLTRTAPGLVLSVVAEADATLIVVRGEVDSFAVPTLMDVLVGVIADRDGDVAVDLSQAEFIDSATARAFARAGHFLAERDRRLIIRSPSRIATRVLTIHDLFHLVEPAPRPQASQTSLHPVYNFEPVQPDRRSR
jgi:anti-anti-sigma factor